MQKLNLQNRCRLIQTPQVFGWHSVAFQVLIRHHFGSYVFKLQVLLQEVGAEPPLRCSSDAAACGFAVLCCTWVAPWTSEHARHSLYGWAMDAVNSQRIKLWTMRECEAKS